MFTTAEFKIKYNCNSLVVWLGFNKEKNVKVINVDIFTFKDNSRYYRALYYPFKFNDCKVVLNNYCENL